MGAINEPLGVGEQVGASLKRATTSIAPGPSGPNGEVRNNRETFGAMLPVTGWKVWYADGSTASSDEVAWWDAPAQGVQVVAYCHEEGRRDLSTCFDEYCLPNSDHVKMGSLICDADFEIIRNEALHDRWRP